MALELGVALGRLVHAVIILREQHRRIWLLHPHAARPHASDAQDSIACEHGESRRSSAFSTWCTASHSVARMNAAKADYVRAPHGAGVKLTSCVSHWVATPPPAKDCHALGLG